MAPPPPADRIEYVAQKVRERRERLGLDQDALKSVVPGAPSRQTVGNLESRRIWPTTSRKRIAWSQALGWEGDALSDLADGREPTETPPAAPPARLPADVADIIDQAVELMDQGLERLRRAVRQLRDQP